MEQPPSVQQGDWAVITLDGEIDLARVDDLAQILSGQWHPTKNLLIDLCSVSFMDSTGLRWLFDTFLDLVVAHREMRLIVVEGGPVERLLAIAGAEQVFFIYHNLDKALERLSARETLPQIDGPHSRFGLFDG